MKFSLELPNHCALEQQKMPSKETIIVLEITGSMLKLLEVV